MPLKHLPCFLVAAVICGCGKPSAPRVEVSVDSVVHEYLLLEHALGAIDANQVDAYFGPESIKSEAIAAKLSLTEIRERAAALDSDVQAIMASAAIDTDRGKVLRARLQALMARVSINNGELMSFDDETAALFGTVAPTHDASHFDAVLAEIDALLPGDGSLGERVNAFKSQFAIPVDRLPEVFETAIAECRRRTLEHIEMADGESFTVEYVSDKPWSGYNWYQGDSISLIQVNTDFPIHIDRAIDLGCHEGYPGHHTFNALIEKNLVEDRGWTEFSLNPLFSPASLIAEGSANYGIELTFPGDERLAYEVEVLFPLAGLDASKVQQYYQLLELLSGLGLSGNEAARGYLDGGMTREQVIDWLMKYSLNTKERAEQRLKFFDNYRSYVH